MRSLALLFLLATLARAERRLVRVTLGDLPFPQAAVKALAAGEEAFFDTTAFRPDALTDERGEAVVDVADGGRVLVYAPGHALSIVGLDRLPVDVQLGPERILNGRVLDATGAPVANASVRLRTTFLKVASLAARTGETGEFHVYGLWLDDYSLSAEAAGFLPSPALLLPRGEGDALLHLDRPATLAGRIVDEEERPVANAGITLGKTSADTDAEGRFRIEGLRPGPLELGLAWPWGEGTRTIDLADGEVREDFTVTALTPATLVLRVTDEEHAPIPGATGRDLAADAAGTITMLVPAGEWGDFWVLAEGFHATRVEYGPEKPGAVRKLPVTILSRIKAGRARITLPDGKPALEGVVENTPIRDGVAEPLEPGHTSAIVPGYPLARFRAVEGAEVEVRLPDPLWLTGFVLTSDGAPIAGATVRALDWEVESTTADDGGFRLGPCAPGRCEIHAECTGYDGKLVELVLAEGALEIRLDEARPPRLLTGEVRRGEKPVVDFTVEGRRFLDPEGRFSMILDAGEGDTVLVGSDNRTYPFPLPSPGEPLLVSLPSGSLRVELEGVGPGVSVTLLDPTSRAASGATAADGAVVFDGLAAGIYLPLADGFERTMIEVAGEGATLLRLQPRPLGFLVLRLPGGIETRLDASRSPIRSSDRLTIEGPPVAAGSEEILDLSPVAGATLHVTNPARGDLSLATEIAGYRVTWTERAASQGEVRFADLPAGRYELRAGTTRQTMFLGEGAQLTLHLEPGPHDLSGVVRFADGRPAPGASVWIADLPISVDQQGRFTIRGVTRGHYSILATAGGCAAARAEVRVDEQGVRGPIEFTLEPSIGAHVRILTPGGHPLSRDGLVVRVNGVRFVTDDLGRCPIDRLPAVLDLELDGFASLRGERVESDGTEIRLALAARLLVPLGEGMDEPRLFVRGRPWPLLRRPGAFYALDLPPGPALLVFAADPPPDPLEIALLAGEETVVDLRR